MTRKKTDSHYGWSFDEKSREQGFHTRYEKVTVIYSLFDSGVMEERHEEVGRDNRFYQQIELSLLQELQGRLIEMILKTEQSFHTEKSFLMVLENWISIESPWIPGDIEGSNRKCEDNMDIWHETCI